MKKILIITFIISCFSTAFFINQAQAQEKNYAENSLIIKIKEPFQDFTLLNIKTRGEIFLSSLDKLNTNYSLVSIEALSENKNSSLYGSYELTFSENKNIKELVKEYKRNEFVKYAEANYNLKLDVFTPNDTYYNQQWNLDTINLPEAWDYDTDAEPYGGDSNIVVAIIDTGVGYENYGSFAKAPDLENTNFVAGYDFVGNDSHPNDDDGHGTSIAEIIAASTNNNYGIAGIAFNVSIMPVRVIEHEAYASAATVAQGIDFAREHGADVINISLGGETSSEVLYDAIKAADEAGIIIVASTGNENEDRIFYPAAYPEVIAVGASNSNNQRTSFSNYGEGLDLVAPGQNIIAEYCVNAPICSSYGLVYVSGTSQAAPHVTAGAALLLSYGTNASSVEAMLTNSSLDLGESGYDLTYGYGLLDLKEALNLAATDSQGPTTTLTTSPSEPNGNNGYFISYPSISLSATDSNGVQATYYRVDSGEWQTYNSAFQLTDGKHLVEYYSKDNLNNSEPIKNTNIYVDTQAPTVTITRPFNNQKMYSNSLIAYGTLDEDTSGLISFTLDGEDIDLSSTSYSKSLSLNKGINNFEYLLEDRAGHTNTLTRSVFYYPRNNIIVGIGPGELPRVRGYNPSNELTGEFLPYITAYRGGVNVTSGDVDNDGVEEIITAPISNGGPHVRVLTNRGEGISQFMAYMESFRGGVNIAAGDVDGDGNVEIVTGAGFSGGPHIRIFDYLGNLKYQFFAYTEVFRGGVKVATGDTNGDGIAEIITGAGPTGGPHVRIFDYQGNVKGQFMAYTETFRGGVNVAAGDLDGDGTAEVITGIVGSGGPHVRIFDINGNLKGQFFAYITSFRGGVNVSAGDYNNDGKYEVITGANSGGGPHVRIFDINGNVKGQFMGFIPSFRGGIMVTGFN